MNIKALHDSLTTKIGLLKQKISIENKVNDFSSNMLMESGIARILNIVFDYDLVNANLIDRNFPGVDLVDTSNQVMIQVSTSGTLEKIKHTVEQVDKHNLKKEYKHLKFFFLGDTRSFADSSKRKIERLLPSGIAFDLDKDVLDFDELFSLLYNEQKVVKTLSVLKVLDDILGFIPESKSTGYESICVASDCNNEHTRLVIDHLLREGINVYIRSEKIYQSFVEEEHRLLDYLILANDTTPIDHIKYAIVVVDNQYVKDNKGLTEIKCHLLSNALANDARIQLLNFNGTFSPALVENTNLRNSIPCSELNLKLTLNKIIDNFFREEDSIALSLEDVTEELCKIYTNFNHTIINLDRKEGFRLIKFELEEFSNMSLYYVLLSKGYVLSSVKERIEKHYSKVPRNMITVLVPKDPLQKTNRRIDNIKKALNVKKVQYVSEHLFEKTLKRKVQEPILEIDDFVEPNVSSEGAMLSGSDAIVNWVTVSSSSSVAIISGQGGIGKTTLCQKIHDKLIGEGDNYHVIFISSPQLMNEFHKVDFSNEHEYEIYNLYVKSCTANSDSGSVVLDRTSFEINYELGNILIVFDGIDELISTIPSFTLDLFLKNVSKIEAGIGRGKIIVNCRDTYINDFEAGIEDIENIDFDRFELLPFDIDLAEDYFKQHFSQKRKIKDCLRLLEEFVTAENETDRYIYPPFIVEIVRLFVEKDIDVEKGDLTFQSRYLSEDNPNDLILYKTCNRELSRKDDRGFKLLVDQQIEFMMELAHAFNGRFEENEYEKILRSIGQRDRTADIALWLRDHPFLVKRGSIYFRFDFLTKFFKSLKIKSILDKPEKGKIDKAIVNLLAEDLEINSQTAIHLEPKIKPELDRYISNAKEVIDLIRDLKLEDDFQVNKAISNLFMMLAQAAGFEDKVRTREILIRLFEHQSENHIVGFYILDVPPSIELTFDFSDFFFSSTVIENYESFLLCDFNENTLFDSTCTINKVETDLTVRKNVTVSIDNFDTNISGDNSLMNSLLRANSDTETLVLTTVTNSLKKFLKCFYDGNILRDSKSIRDLRVNYKYSGGSIDFDLILNAMLRQEIIHQEADVLQIDSHFRSKISKSVHQGLNFDELNEILHEIIEFENQKVLK